MHQPGMENPETGLKGSDQNALLHKKPLMLGIKNLNGTDLKVVLKLRVLILELEDRGISALYLCIYIY